MNLVYAGLFGACGRLGSAAHDFNKAAELYTKAIDKNPGDATLWCNRAYTRIKLEEHGYGLHDAGTYRSCLRRTVSVPEHGYFSKVWLLSSIRNMRRRMIGVSWTFDFASFHVSDNPNRRATCYLQTVRYKQAIADFKKLLTLEPQNQLVRMQLDSTQKILRKVEFEKVHLH